VWNVATPRPSARPGSSPASASPPGASACSLIAIETAIALRPRRSSDASARIASPVAGALVWRLMWLVATICGSALCTARRPAAPSTSTTSSAACMPPRSSRISARIGIHALPDCVSPADRIRRSNM